MNKQQTEQAKRRARYEAAKIRELNSQHASEMALARMSARQEGYDEGKKDGAAVMRQHVLDQAGQLYKEGKDADATAVRDAHRKMPVL
jgi:hypothetical protein